MTVQILQLSIIYIFCKQKSKKYCMGKFKEALKGRGGGSLPLSCGVLFRSNRVNIKEKEYIYKTKSYYRTTNIQK